MVCAGGPIRSLPIGSSSGRRSTPRPNAITSNRWRPRRVACSIRCTHRSRRDRRAADEFDQNTFAAKSTELGDRLARLKAEHQPGNSHSRRLAEKVFELSQTLETKWFVSNSAEKRQLLKTVCLNFSLQGASLVPTIRKPFDVLAEGLSVSFSRGEEI